MGKTNPKITVKPIVDLSDLKLSGLKLKIQTALKINGALPIDDLYRHPEVLHFANVQTEIAPHPKPVNIASLQSPVNEKAINAVLQAIPMQSLLVKHHLSKPKNIGHAGVVAILDTGVNAKHRDLKGKVLFQTTYTGDKDAESVSDMHGHGTHLAGLICGTTRTIKYTLPRKIGRELSKFFQIKDEVKLETGGINPDARIVSIKITDGAAGHTSWSNITKGLEQVMDYNTKAKHGDKVSCVLIAYNGFDNVSELVDVSNLLMSEHVNKLYADKIPVVVSSGNMQEYFAAGTESPKTDGLAYPAYMRNVIAAGALKADGTVAEFSQRVYEESPNYSSRFISVYGDQTLGPGIDSNDAYTLLRGSSVSAAVLAGAITLLQARYSSFHIDRMPSVDSLVLNMMNRSGRTTHREGHTTRRIKTLNLNACLQDMGTI